MVQIKVSHTTDFASKVYEEQLFKEIFCFNYIPHLTFSNWHVEQTIRRGCQKKFSKNCVSQNAHWLGILHREAILSGYVPDITIKWVDPRIGYGVFTNRPIKAWEFIGEYAGILRQRTRIFIDTNDYCFMYPKTGQLWQAFTIDSEKQGNFTRFINHSDTPNLESLSVFTGGLYRIIFRALTDIPAYTELTYDYGDLYWKARKKA